MVYSYILLYWYKYSTKLCFFQVKLNVPFCWIQPVEPPGGATGHAHDLCNCWPVPLPWTVPPAAFGLSFDCLLHRCCPPPLLPTSTRSTAAAEIFVQAQTDTCHRAPRRTTKGWLKLSSQSLRYCSPLAARRLAPPVPHVLPLFILVPRIVLVAAGRLLTAA